MKHRYFITIFLVIFIVCILLCIYTATGNNGGFAEIYSDGELVRRINLTITPDPYEFVVSKDGHSNTISVKDGSISVTSADCPDKLCVFQGAIQNSSYPIVCLPNKLIIKITGKESSEAIPDAVSK